MQTRSQLWWLENHTHDLMISHLLSVIGSLQHRGLCTLFCLLNQQCATLMFLLTGL